MQFVRKHIFPIVASAIFFVVVLALVIVTFGNNFNWRIPSMYSTPPVPFSATVPSTTSSGLNNSSDPREKSIAEALAVYRQTNLKILKSYSGLPHPKEDDRTIQVYEKILDSSSGNSTMYSLTTYSKLVADINDFSGSLGFLKTSFFVCNKNSNTCEPSTIIERAIKHKQPGYAIGVGFCFLGWDVENARIYSYSCGAGGDRRVFGEFDYRNDAAYIYGEHEGPSFYLSINKQLTVFAIEQTDSASNPAAILIYSVDAPVKPIMRVDLVKLAAANVSNGMPNINFSWNSDGNTATFAYANHSYMLNVKTGTVVQI